MGNTVRQCRPSPWHLLLPRRFALTIHASHAAHTGPTRDLLTLVPVSLNSAVLLPRPPPAQVLEDLEKGKIPFNEAAREYSIDKAGRSGLLGWKRRNELDQDFWAAALEVEEGDYTKEPVKTQVSLGRRRLGRRCAQVA